MVYHDALLCFLMKETSGDYLCTLDVVFAYIGYGFVYVGYGFCVSYTVFSYVYGFGIHIIGLD